MVDMEKLGHVTLVQDYFHRCCLQALHPKRFPLVFS